MTYWHFQPSEALQTTWPEYLLLYAEKIADKLTDREAISDPMEANKRLAELGVTLAPNK